MADNDVLFKDQSATPAAFYPESQDLGSSVRRSMFGSADGAQVALGATTDPEASTGNGTAIALLKRIRTLLGGLLTVDTVVKLTSTSRSGTIAAGGTAQQLAAANSSRRGIAIQNQSTGDLWINGTGTAAADQTSLRIPAGALYESPSHHVGVGAISIIGATTGQAFWAREF